MEIEKLLDNLGFVFLKKQYGTQEEGLIIAYHTNNYLDEEIKTPDYKLKLSYLDEEDVNDNDIFWSRYKIEYQINHDT